MKRPSRPILILIGSLLVSGIILVRLLPRGSARSFTSAHAEPTVRAPAVMGSFYPAQTSVLRSDVERYLEKADGPTASGDLVALIVPHAGYPYSAPVAAYAYRLLAGRHFDTVAVIGPGHRVPVQGAALSGLDEWFTPLGLVKTDHSAADAVMKAYPAARVFDAAHDPEHSIEVQLPFLQLTLGDFKLLPILMTDFSQNNCSRLAQALAGWARDKSVLLVASSDMSHYPSYNDAVRVDRETLKAIETMDAGEVAATTRKLMAQGVPGLVTALCGEGPVETVLLAARLLGADRVEVLKYANSGDRNLAPREGVVGYGAVAIYRTRPLSDTELNAAQQQRLLDLARRTIEEYVRTGRRLDVAETDPSLLRPAAAFVTLREGGQLRGCIGSLEPSQPLAETVRDRAIMAAAQDPRFSPVRAQELPTLDVEISVLSPLRRVASADDIDIPKHGVVVRSGGRSGVFLPQVAEETGWSRDELLSHLCRDKAGLPADAWKQGAALYVFTVQAFTSPAPGASSHARSSPGT
jgi:AmmeMemoRadiSam system protein B/AmmeMemoRadiSam system protein A